MIVIGTDTHKRTHALSAVDEGTGKVRGHRQIDADEPGHLAAVKWARGLDDQRVWAIEDCRQVSRRLEQALRDGRNIARHIRRELGPDHVGDDPATTANRRQLPRLGRFACAALQPQNHLRTNATSRWS